MTARRRGGEHRVGRLLLAGALLFLAVPPARANVAEELAPPDESKFHRKGFSAGALLGVAALIGTGRQDEIRGFGPSVNLRVGTRANSAVQWILELDIAGYITVDQGEDRRDDIKNNIGNLTLGAQYFVRPTLWLRGGLGVARSQLSSIDPEQDDVIKQGLAVVGGAGLDVWQRRFFAVDVELTLGLGLYEKGSIFTTGVGIAVNLY